jgi:hypothetical protein
MREVVAPVGWYMHESGERWYWDGWGWRGNQADFDAAVTPAEVAAQLKPRRQSTLAIPSGPDVLPIEIVGEDRHMAAITSLFAAFGHDSDELTIAAQLRTVPGHRNDPLAMEVLIDGQVVGHIPSELTPAIQPRVAVRGFADGVARVWLGTHMGKARARITVFYVAA